MSHKCDIDLRLASEEDAQHIYKIHTSAIQELCSSHYSLQEINGWVRRQKIDNYLTFISKEVMYVGVIKDQVVGFGHLEKFSDCTGEIFGLYASPQHSKMGVGTHLLRHLEDQAKLKCYTSMRVKSTLNAKSFYESMGYDAVDEDDHVVGGTSLRCVLMIKTL